MPIAYARMTALPKNTLVGLTSTVNVLDGFITPIALLSNTSVTLYPPADVNSISAKVMDIRIGVAIPELNSANAQLPFGNIGLVQTCTVSTCKRR